MPEKKKRDMKLHLFTFITSENKLDKYSKTSLILIHCLTLVAKKEQYLCDEIFRTS